MRLERLIKLIQQLQDALFTGSLTVRFHNGAVAKHVDKTLTVSLLADEHGRDKETSDAR